MQILGFLATPLGYVMEFVYYFVQNYGWTLILFTVLIRLVMFPVTLNQQKSMARNAAYQPMMQEIQKKWANDKNKQQQELMKFQEENNIKMTAGCLPMIINMVVLFSVIEVIYRPLRYILHVPMEIIDAAAKLLPEGSTLYAQQSLIIGEVIAGNSDMISTLGEYAEAIGNFNFNFMGLNLARLPEWSASGWVYLILPVLSILTMFLSQLIVMKTSGQAQGKGSMIVMTVVMGVMFGVYAFTVPVAFSLYYTASNIVMTIQQIISKKIYDPEKYKAQLLEEIEERKKLKKAKKVVKVQDESGSVIAKEVSDAELAKLRLQRARELDAERYGDTVEEQKAIDEAAEKARKIDEEKYGKIADKSDDKKEEIVELEPEAVVELEASEEPEPAKQEAPKTEYKPGRRARAKQQKKGEPASFADMEKQNEINAKGEE